MIAALVLNTLLTCLDIQNLVLCLVQEFSVCVYCLPLLKGVKKVCVKPGKTEETWKRARWIDIHIFQVKSLSYPKAGGFIPCMLTVRIFCCYRLVWNTLCINSQSSLISFYFHKQKAVLTKTLVSQGGRHMLGRKCITNVKNANLWPFRTQEVQRNNNTETSRW